MTKKQFLKKLEAKLGSLSRRERKRYVADYDEMIADMMESGLTEQEAVERLGSAEKIAREILEGAGAREPRRLDLPGTLLAAASLVLLAVSLYKYMSLRTMFGGAEGLLTGEAVSVIGGADGPTSIFLAGKVSDPLALYVIAGCCLLVTIFYFLKKFKRK